MKNLLSWIAALLAVCLCAPAMNAEGEKTTKLPSAREVIDKYVAAIGGKEALLKHNSQHAKGKFEVQAQGLSGNLEVWAIKPNKLLIRIDLPGIGKMENGFDGETGWSIDPLGGPKLLEGKQLDQLRNEADFLAPLHEEKNFKSMETVETVVFEGKACFKLKLVRQSGEESHEYYDTKTGLLHAVEINQATPMGSIKAVNIAAEYKAFDGLKVATKSIQKTMGMSPVMSLHSVDFEPVSERIFDLPEAIKSLKKK